MLKTRMSVLIREAYSPRRLDFQFRVIQFFNVAASFGTSPGPGMTQLQQAPGETTDEHRWMTERIASAMRAE